MKLLKILNPQNATEDEIAKYPVRNAARAILCDKEGNIGILNVTKRGYHKLPGGGIEEGENVLDALKRECKEELGCDVEALGEVGQIIEYRKIFELTQNSFCYLANLVGEKGTPSLTQEEVESGFVVQWFPVKKVMSVLASDRPQNDEGSLYIVPRDRIFLEAAKEQLDRLL